ncbi:hypothetical protein KDD30_21745 (plasmid) [Photobacterium sp. GJ3]|uniref:hypothetical protein n=1 Tax=Photobacterium sp. GJ3 TaxID=2829502 RepID=UPI001B8C8776|nr:hypothetical protein [Photobacterium sp. GJ3]QUJ69392.1 hypothetical protein KDD30_21745 [Photobacterium sp. GJ3]
MWLIFILRVEVKGKDFSAKDMLFYRGINMNVICKKTINICSLIFTMIASAHAIAETKKGCSELVLDAMYQDAKQHNETTFNNSEFISVSCKNMPNESDTLVASYLQKIREYDIGSSYLWRVMKTSKTNGSVLASYTGYISEDSSIQVGEDSIWIDTAKYDLAENQRAFGVRLDIGYSPRCADGGESDYLTLFLQDGTHLKPVLKNIAMSTWSNYNGIACLDPEIVKVDEKKYIFILNSKTNGFNDLLIKGKSSTETKTELASEILSSIKEFHSKYVYDGSSYNN